MDKEEKIQRVNDSIQNTMSSTIGIEINDIDNDFISFFEVLEVIFKIDQDLLNR